MKKNQYIKMQESIPRECADQSLVNFNFRVQICTSYTTRKHTLNDEI